MRYLYNKLSTSAHEGFSYGVGENRRAHIDLPETMNRMNIFSGQNVIQNQQ